MIKDNLKIKEKIKITLTKGGKSLNNSTINTEPKKEKDIK